MSRPVDLERQQARRLQIIDAALTVFATHGYHGASTAEICRQARIGSGTFFHYFPAKLKVLLGILAAGTAETREFASTLEASNDPLVALDQIIDRVAAEAQDWRVAGFVQTVAGVMTMPPVAEALADDERAEQNLITTWVVRGARNGQIRTDISPERITAWMQLLFNGFLERIATDPKFNVEQEHELLRETVHRLLGQ